MKWKKFINLWGHLERAVDRDAAEKLFARIKAAGYDGIEWVPTVLFMDPELGPFFTDLFQKYEFDFIPAILPQGGSEEPELKDLRAQLEASAKLNPILANAHMGRDCWRHERNVKVFKEALEITKDYDFPVVFETHRRRALFSPWTCEWLLNDLPDLKIAADFSHFPVVAESPGDEYEKEIDLCCQRAYHLQGRISYPGGAQIPDPNGEEYQEQISIFKGWWKKIIQYRKAEGWETFTFQPEYGPFPYLQLNPTTHEPFMTPWDMNLWCFQEFEKVFDEVMAEA